MWMYESLHLIPKTHIHRLRQPQEEDSSTVLKKIGTKTKYIPKKYIMCQWLHIDVCVCLHHYACMYDYDPIPLFLHWDC